MATANFYLRTTQSDKASIYVNLTIANKKQLRKSTGLKINPKHWKSESKSFGYPKNVGEENIKIVRNKLNKLKTHLLDKVNFVNGDGTIINNDWLKNQINICFELKTDEEIKNELVTFWIQDYINNAHIIENGKGSIGLSESRIKGYNALKNTINEYNKNLLISDCGTATFENFKKWLISKQYAPTTLYKKISDLKTICKYAQSKGIIVSSELGAIKTKKGSAYDDDMNVITLTELEIKKIEDLKLNRLSLINARKWLILACYTGQRGTALTERIIKENFHPHKDGYKIVLKQKKGNKIVSIPVLPKVKKIFESGLPHKISLQNLNNYIKEIGQLAKIDEPTIGTIKESIKMSDKKTIQRNVKAVRPKWMYFASHIGRRTFATNHYKKIPTPVIMRVTGHQKESTFLNYINQTDEDHLDDFFNYYENIKEVKEEKETPVIEIKILNK